MADIRVWVDGALVPADAPSVSAVDHGVTVGDGAFETVKIEGGLPFAVTRHLRRLDRTTAGLGLPRADHDRVRAGIAAVLTGEPIGFGRLRFTVTGGHGPLGSDRHDSDLTHIVTAVAHARPEPHGAVVTVPWVRNERAATAGPQDDVLRRERHRPGPRQGAGRARGGVRQHPGRAVRGHREQRVRRRRRRPAHPAAGQRVPRRHHPRASCIEWCRDAGIDVVEEALPLDVLARADEVFLTSSIKDVFPVSAVDGRVLPAPGPVTALARDVWAAGAAAGTDP